KAEAQGGASEMALASVAKTNQAWVVGSYAEKDGQHFFHTVVLMDPQGAVAGRYRQIHLSGPETGWASSGDAFTVVSTPLGRVGLVVADELEIPEVIGMYTSHAADIL